MGIISSHFRLGPYGGGVLNFLTIVSSLLRRDGISKRDALATEIMLYAFISTEKHLFTRVCGDRAMVLLA